jgi:hypothetical protein
MTLWNCDPHAEAFAARTATEAIDEYLDAMSGPLPHTLVAVRYEPEVITDADRDKWAEALRDKLIEWFDDDEELAGGDDSGDESKPEHRDEQLALARALVDAVVEHYCVYNHHETDRIEVDVLHWIRTHRPDWLEMRNGVIQVTVEAKP